MTQVHPSAVVSPSAQLGRNVVVGPFCVIEDEVIIGDESRLGSHVVVKNGTALGANNVVCEAAILGGKPQHSRAGDELGPLLIGNDNVIREHVTIHRGLTAGTCTTVGEGNMIMVNAHIAHDCQIGNRTVIVNNVMIAGHVVVQDRVYFGGAAGIHQFARVGQLAMVGGQSHLSQDVPPFVNVDGKSNLICGLNLIGLRRAGFSSAEIRELKAAYRVLYRSGLTWNDTLEVLANTFQEGPASEFHRFLIESERGIVQERKTPRNATIPLPSDEERVPLRKVA